MHRAVKHSSRTLDCNLGVEGHASAQPVQEVASERQAAEHRDRSEDKKCGDQVASKGT